MAIVETSGLCKTYGSGPVEVRALRDIDLAIDEGEFVAIMGPSGSGKTTLLNILGCLDRPSAGSYRLLGTEVAELSRGELADIRNLILGFVFQSYNLLSRTSALDNVQLPLIYASVGRRERRERASEVLARVDLGDRLDAHPNQLSGGQQQRVAIARALINRPRVILADEPTGSLDTRTGTEIMALFQELGSSGITILCVTHEAEIARFASRVLTIRDGRISEDRRQQPADAAVIARGAA